MFGYTSSESRETGFGSVSTHRATSRSLACLRPRPLRRRRRPNGPEMSDPDPRLDPYDFLLPAGQIARTPPADRDGGRLLARQGGRWLATRVAALDAMLQPGDVLVVNDTRVLSARLHAVRQSGGRVEVLLLGAGPGPVRALVKPGRKIRVGEELALLDPTGATSRHRLIVGDVADGGERWVSLEDDALEVMAACGHIPLPPYLEREADSDDEHRYQTIFATEPGAVAAPTASLHLSNRLVERLEGRGVEVCRITLHVGAGTFRNLRSADLDRGRLHRERYRVPLATAAAIGRARERGSRVVAVGTTVTRTLESAASTDGQVRAGWGETSLFIQPGFEFRVVDALLTNFHLPRSSLLMLVCAFGGRDEVLTGYATAVREGFRFYSYGDAMFLTRGER